MQRKTRRRTPTLERMELRQLLAGDVTAGLVNRWTFDETSGDIAADVVGGNNAALANWGAAESKWVSGRFGGGLDFDGVNNYAIVSTAVSLPKDPLSSSLFMSSAAVRGGSGGDTRARRVRSRGSRAHR